MVQTVLPYHQVMSPKWIHSNAVITTPYALYPHYFAILPTTGVNHQRALQIQLVAPNVLTSTDSVTVTITFAVDVSIASSNDHDPSVGISDGESFIGFKVHDRAASPCDHYKGDSNTGVLQNKNHIIGPVVTSRRYSSEIKLHIRPVEQWGSCHTEHDEGYTNIASYEHLLDPSKGLYLEWNHGSINEN